MLIIQRYFYHNQGKLEQAESLYQRTLAIQERMPGPEHPDTAQSLNNLAVLYSNQSKYQQAESLYQRALAIREKRLGPEHPRTKGTRDNLTRLQEKMRQRGETADPDVQSDEQ